MTRLPNIAVRIEGQIPLADQKNHPPYEPEQIYGQQSPQKLLPVHFFLRINPGQAEHQPFNRLHEIKPCFLLLVNLGNIFPQRIAQSHHKNDLRNNT